MKYAKILSLTLVVFTLFGCNKTPGNSQIVNPVEAANTPQQENSVSQQVAKDGDSSPAQITHKVKVDSSSRKIAQNKSSIKSSKSGIIDETSYDTALKSLNSLTKGCQESKKTPEGTTTNYSICKLGGKTLKASAYSPVAGAGNEYWFVDNRVIAVQQFHTTELFIYDNNGKLKSKFNYPNKVTTISNQDRQEAQRLYNGYDYIFEVFNNKKEAKAPSTKYGTIEEVKAKIKKLNGRIIGSASCDGDGLENDVRVDYNGDGMPDECVSANLKIDNPIIDETSFQTVSKSLESITKGCTKTKKTEDNLNFEICKKGDTVVSASEYAPEADAGSVYWFSTDGKLVAMRYFGSGDTYVFDSNYKVSSKFNVYDAKKVDTITAQERKRVEEDSYFSYRRILDVFNI